MTTVRVRSPEELEYAAETIDWDGDLSDIYEIIRSPNCDLGSALRVYWRAGAQWFAQYASESDVPDFEKGGWKLCDEIEQRVLSYFYSHHRVHFDARNDDGSDHTGDYLDYPMRRTIPPEMFQPFPAPEPFSSDIISRAMADVRTLPSKRRLTAAMHFLRRRLQSGTDLAMVVREVKKQLDQLSAV